MTSLHAVLGIPVQNLASDRAVLGKERSIHAVVGWQIKVISRNLMAQLAIPSNTRVLAPERRV